MICPNGAREQCGSSGCDAAETPQATHNATELFFCRSKSKLLLTDTRLAPSIEHWQKAARCFLNSRIEIVEHRKPWPAVADRIDEVQQRVHKPSCSQSAEGAQPRRIFQ
jgi:hypothetical protein